MQNKECGVNTVIARICNSIVEGLNSRPRLPRLIIVVPDSDIIADINEYEFGTPREIRLNLRWLIRQIDMVIRRRKLEILEKKPGAVYDSDPKIIYVKMVKRSKFYPQSSKIAKICTMRAKFNNELNEVVAEENHHILGIESCESEDCFDAFGKLTTKGKFLYWKEMCELIERFDKKKVKLVPKQYHRNRDDRARSDNKDNRSRSQNK